MELLGNTLDSLRIARREAELEAAAFPGGDKRRREAALAEMGLEPIRPSWDGEGGLKVGDSVVVAQDGPFFGDLGRIDAVGGSGAAARYVVVVGGDGLGGALGPPMGSSTDTTTTLELGLDELATWGLGGWDEGEGNAGGGGLGAVGGTMGGPGGRASRYTGLSSGVLEKLAGEVGRPSGSGGGDGGDPRGKASSRPQSRAERKANSRKKKGKT